MVTEDYVSFETACLLKDKGFDGDTSCYCTPDNEKRWVYQHYQDFDKKDRIECPTLQMAMKWLREKHNLCVEPYRTACGYLYTIRKIWTGSCIANPSEGGDDEDSGQYTTWEKACEAAIKYCLTNLI